MTYYKYKQARKWIRDGDLLLYRRRGLISVVGRGVHTHAAKAAWWDGDLFCLEVRELLGGRAVLLSREASLYPGRIDVYEPNPDNRWPKYDRREATRWMRRICGCDYGWHNLFLAAMLHLPLVRLWMRAAVDDNTVDRRPPFCSQACAMADRIGGGVDPVHQLADRLTEPADLARSPFYKYRFTIEE